MLAMNIAKKRTITNSRNEVGKRRLGTNMLDSNHFAQEQTPLRALPAVLPQRFLAFLPSPA